MFSWIKKNWIDSCTTLPFPFTLMTLCGLTNTSSLIPDLLPRVVPRIPEVTFHLLAWKAIKVFTATYLDIYSTCPAVCVAGAAQHAQSTLVWQEAHIRTASPWAVTRGERCNTCGIAVWLADYGRSVKQWTLLLARQLPEHKFTAMYAVHTGEAPWWKYRSAVQPVGIAGIELDDN